MTTLPLPPTGTIDGNTHLMPVRVYYEDTDAGGIVYHANYLRFAERARTEMLRAIGIDLIQMRDEHDLIFVVHKGEIQYRRPARLDDILVIRSELSELSAATAVIEQSICRVETDAVSGPVSGEELAHFRAHVACMHPAGRVGRFPKDLHARMKSLIRPASPDPAAHSHSRPTG